MSSFVSTLGATQLANIKLIQERMKKRGITNPYTQAAIFAVVSKESKFIPQTESGYSKTSNTRIREVFGKLAAIKALSEAQLTALKANDVAFFNAVYGGKYGTPANEGYKYRGRGFNQLTFKGSYLSIGKKIGVDLVANPDLANRVDVAADILLQFFIDAFASGKAAGKLAAFNTTGLNDFKTLNDALRGVFQANRGWNNTGPDTTGGFEKAASRVASFYDFVGKNAGAIGGGAFFFTDGDSGVR